MALVRDDVEALHYRTLQVEHEATLSEIARLQRGNVQEKLEALYKKANRLKECMARIEAHSPLRLR